MPLTNIALIISPNLFLNQINLKTDQTKQIAINKNSCEVTKMIINYCDILFKVPGFIIDQIDHVTNF